MPLLWACAQRHGTNCSHEELKLWEQLQQRHKCVEAEVEVVVREEEVLKGEARGAQPMPLARLATRPEGAEETTRRRLQRDSS